MDICRAKKGALWYKIEDIWDSIAADQMALPMTDEQRAELDRRLDAYERVGICHSWFAMI